MVLKLVNVCSLIKNKMNRCNLERTDCSWFLLILTVYFGSVQTVKKHLLTNVMWRSRQESAIHTECPLSLHLR